MYGPVGVDPQQEAKGFGVARVRHAVGQHRHPLRGTQDGIGRAEALRHREQGLRHLPVPDRHGRTGGGEGGRDPRPGQLQCVVAIRVLHQVVVGPGHRQGGGRRGRHCRSRRGGGDRCQRVRRRYRGRGCGHGAIRSRAAGHAGGAAGQAQERQQDCQQQPDPKRAGGVDPHGAGSQMSVQGRRGMATADDSALSVGEPRAVSVLQTAVFDTAIKPSRWPNRHGPACTPSPKSRHRHHQEPAPCFHPRRQRFSGSLQAVPRFRPGWPAARLRCCCEAGAPYRRTPQTWK